MCRATWGDCVALLVDCPVCKTETGTMLDRARSPHQDCVVNGADKGVLGQNERVFAALVLSPLSQRRAVSPLSSMSDPMMPRLTCMRQNSGKTFVPSHAKSVKFAMDVEVFDVPHHCDGRMGTWIQDNMREERERQRLGLPCMHNSDEDEDEDDDDGDDYGFGVWGSKCAAPMIAPAASPEHHIYHDHLQQARVAGAEQTKRIRANQDNGKQQHHQQQQQRQGTKQGKSNNRGGKCNNEQLGDVHAGEDSEDNSDGGDETDCGEKGVADGNDWLVIEFDDDIDTRLSSKRAASLSPSELLLPRIVGPSPPWGQKDGEGDDKDTFSDSEESGSESEWAHDEDDEENVEDTEEEDEEDEDEDVEDEIEDADGGDADSVTFAACSADCECACCGTDEPSWLPSSWTAVQGRVRI